jgi:hypothetical protein
LLILIGFAFTATAPDEPWSRGVLLLIQCGTLITALWTSRSGPLELRLTALVLTVGLAVLQILTNSKALTATVAAFSGLLVIAIGVVIVRGIISEGTVSQRSVVGAICIYFLLGMLFLFAYGVVAVLDSGPFFAQGTDGTLALRLYFSFVTLATVGYGDYTTASNLGHMLSVLEALIGQLYLVTVIAVLVSRMHSDPTHRCKPCTQDTNCSSIHASRRPDPAVPRHRGGRDTSCRAIAALLRQRPSQKLRGEESRLISCLALF